MKVFLILMAVLSLPLAGSSLNRGDVFPRLTLPAIAGGEDVPVQDFFGEKLVLHLFASW